MVECRMATAPSSSNGSAAADASITIHDVALAAGVSIKTVSRVLRDERHVAAATRAQVQAAAQHLGYAPHPSARNLASAVPQVVGLLTTTSPNPAGSLRGGHEYLMALQLGVLQACGDLGHAVRLQARPVAAGQAGGEELAAELAALVRSRGIGGLVIPAPLVDQPGLLRALDAANVPYAAISPANTAIAGPWVVADERSAARELVALLVSLGHRRIACITGDKGSRGGTERLAGYHEGMAAAGLPVNPAWVEPGGFLFDQGRAAAHTLLRRNPRPSAIMAANDDSAAGVLAAAHDRGLVLPDDLSVTGYDDIDLARKVWPGLTTVRQPLGAMAQVAARQLIARMHPLRRSDDAPASQVVLPAELVVRGSTRTPLG